MKVSATEIPEVLLIEPKVYGDDRGYFVESYQAEKYRAAGVSGAFVQDNRSRSIKGTLRGLHMQSRRPQAKLVWVVAGEVFDVAVDLRPDAPTFKQWVGVTLSESNYRQLYIPPGFAHGFCVLSDFAVFEYKCSDYYDPGGEVSVNWRDPELAIEWPVKEPLLSAKDAGAPLLAQIFQQKVTPN